MENILADLKRFGRYYVDYSLGQQKDTKLREPFRRLRQIVEVALQLILKKRGHPLAGLSSRRRLSRGEEFVFFFDPFSIYGGEKLDSSRGKVQNAP